MKCRCVTKAEAVDPEKWQHPKLGGGGGGGGGEVMKRCEGEGRVLFKIGPLKMKEGGGIKEK